MAQNQIWLEKGGGAPHVVVTVAAGSRGTCRIRLWDPDGRNPAEKDRFPFDCAQPFEHTSPPLNGLDDVGSLNNCTLTWALRIAPRQPDTEDQYEIRIRVVQNARTVPGGEFIYSGPLEDAEEVGDAALFSLR
jgi:hypothetical protein